MALQKNNSPFLHCIRTFVSRRVVGNTAESTKFVELPEVMGVTLSVTKNSVDVKSANCETLGQTTATLSRITDITGTLSCAVQHTEAFRAALSGIVSPITGTAGTVTAEEIVFPTTPGVWIPLVRNRISVPVISGSTLGTDYEVNYAIGMISALPDGNVVGTTKSLAYSYAAGAGSEQEVGNLSQIEWAIKAELKNLYDPSADKLILEIDAATININGGVKLSIATPDDQEAVVMQFDLSLRTLSDETAPARIKGLPAQVYNWLP